MSNFAEYDIIDDLGNRVAHGHKASFCLEDNYCMEEVPKKYACAGFGDQGEASSLVFHRCCSVIYTIF